MILTFLSKNLLRTKSLSIFERSIYVSLRKGTNDGLVCGWEGGGGVCGKKTLSFGAYFSPTVVFWFPFWPSAFQKPQIVTVIMKTHSVLLMLQHILPVTFCSRIKCDSLSASKMTGLTDNMTTWKKSVTEMTCITWRLKQK